MRGIVQSSLTPSIKGLRLRPVGPVAVGLVCFWLTSHVAARMTPPGRLDEIEGPFFEQLVDRQLFELAEEYCLDRLDSRRDTESQAFWIDRLTTAYRQHAWHESGPNRTALTQSAVKSITEFLETQVVSPGAELTLRLAQVDVLLNLIRIDSYLLRVGHRGPKMQHHAPQLDGLNSRISQAAKLVDGLSGQLNRVGRQLKRQQTSRLREQARRISAELQAIQVLMNHEDSATVMKLLYRLERSARSDSTRWRTLELQTELLLLAGDFDRNDLTLRRIDDLFPERYDEQTVLRIHSLLRKGQPTEALTLTESIHPLSPIAQNHSPEVLRLESLLQLRMLAGQLQDVGLIDKTDSQFHRLAENSVSWTPSVQRDAAQSLIASYQLIRTVGSDVAGLIEYVETLQARGEHDDAIRELQRALKVLRADAPLRSRGAICLAIGELHIAQESWDNAVAALRLAVQHFHQAELPEFASRADLLHAFCLGQQWRAAPNDEHLHAAYVDSLMKHRTQWDGQESWDTATNWLIQVTQSVDPFLACELLQEVAQRAAVPADRVDALTRWGMLLDAHQNQSPATRSPRDPAAAFLKACQDIVPVPDDLASETAVLRLVELSVRTDHQTSWEQWKAVAEELPVIRRQLTAPDAATQARLSELQLVATSRTSTNLDVQEQFRTVYTRQYSTEPLRGAQRLSRFLTNSGRIVPGDSFIAETIEILLSQQLQTSDPASERLTLFSLSCLTGRITGNHKLKEQLLSLILKEDLTTDQVKRLAQTLLDSQVDTNSDSGGDLIPLWNRIRAESSEGSELWLEASLQLAEMRSQSGRAEQAEQQLRVTNVLYPEWGTPERLDRVNQLLKRLASSPGRD